MATIEPSPRSTISRAYACATMNVPNVLTARIRSNSARVISSDGTGGRCRPPARPCPPRVCARRATAIELVVAQVDRRPPRRRARLPPGRRRRRRSRRTADRRGPPCRPRARSPGVARRPPRCRVRRPPRRSSSVVSFDRLAGIGPRRVPLHAPAFPAKGGGAIPKRAASARRSATWRASAATPSTPAQRLGRDLGLARHEDPAGRIRRGRRLVSARRDSRRAARRMPRRRRWRPRRWRGTAGRGRTGRPCRTGRRSACRTWPRPGHLSGRRPRAPGRIPCNRRSPRGRRAA